MFNRVKYLIIQNLKQTSKNKEKFVKNKKQYNQINKILYNPIVVRKYHTMNNNQQLIPPESPDNDWIIICALLVGASFTFRKK
jgi:hypothetical protein